LFQKYNKTVAINSMVRICMQPMISWKCTQEGLSFSIGKGGEFYNCCVLILFLCVPNDLSTCFPCPLYDVLQVPNEFPKGVPNSRSLVGGQFSPSQLYSWPNERDSIHIVVSILGSISSFSFWFFGDDRIKMTHGQKKRNYNWEAVRLVNRIGRVFFGRAISLSQK
jgi:hypothetical protein